jgi:hypothetical protein
MRGCIATCLFLVNHRLHFICVAPACMHSWTMPFQLRESQQYSLEVDSSPVCHGNSSVQGLYGIVLSIAVAGRLVTSLLLKPEE